MSADASFHEGAEKPLNLGAFTTEDLEVVSALAQDGLFNIANLRFDRAQGRVAILLNRFRWEDVDAARTRRRPVERVQSVLSIETVQRMESQGIERGEADLVFSLLSLGFTPAPQPPGGALTITLAGDGAFRLQVEALQVQLRDVTRPYLAPTGHIPQHSGD